MIKYTKKKMRCGEGKHMLVAYVAEPKYEILSNLLTYDVPIYGGGIADILGKVIEGTQKPCKFECDVCRLKVRKDETSVESISGNETLGNPCIVPTGELKELALSWIQEIVKDEEGI